MISQKTPSPGLFTFVLAIFSFMYLPFANAQVIEDVGTLKLNQLEFYDVAYGVGVGNDGLIVTTDNGGSYWHSTSLNQVNSPKLTSVFIETGTAKTYIGGDNGVIMKSIDHGKTWLPIAIPFTYPVTDMYFSGDTLGMVVLSDINYNSYLLSTHDGGNHWTTLAHKQSFFNIEFPSPNVGFMIQTESIYKTTNQGRIWTLVSKARQYDYYRDVDFITPEIGFLTTGNETFKTTNGGLTWNQVGAGGPGRIQFVSETTGYLGSLGGGILSKTTDGGATWKPVMNSKYFNAGPAPFYFLDELTGFFQNYETGDMFKTIDGGKNWVLTLTKVKFSYNVHLSSYLHAISDHELFCVQGDSMILHSYNGGLYYHIQTVGSDKLNSIYFNDQLHGYAVGEEGAYYVSGDGGETWKKQNIDTEAELLKVAFIDSQHGIITGNNATVLKTTNGGAKWTDVSLDLPPGIFVYNGGIVNDTTLWVIASEPTRVDQGFYKSTDGGVNWKSYPNKWIQSFSDGYMANTLDISLASPTGWFLASSDGGETYNQVDLLEPIKSLHFPRNQALGFATGDNGYLSKTTDKGKSWNLIGKGYYNFDIVRMLNDSTGFLAQGRNTERVSCDFSRFVIRGDFYGLCPGTRHYYTLYPYIPNVEWTVIGGTIDSQDEGSITIIWNDEGERYIEAKLTSKGCNATRTITQTISTNVLKKTSILGTSAACSGNQQYSVANPLTGVNYSWKVANGDLIKSDTIIDWVSVQWNTPGTHWISVTSDDKNCLQKRIDTLDVEIKAAPINWYEDNDGDGFGNINKIIQSCSTPARYVANDDDCDDQNSSIKTATKLYEDKDGDGLGNSYKTIQSCSTPVGYVTNADDCNDNDSSIKTIPIKWYEDKDGDGFGNSNKTIQSCLTPQGYVSNTDDCDDNDSLINTCVVTAVADEHPMRKQVYPNPCSSLCQLDFAKDVKVELRDIFGQLLTTLDSNATLDVSNLSSGVYLVSANGQTTRLMVVK